MEVSDKLQTFAGENSDPEIGQFSQKFGWNVFYEILDILRICFAIFLRKAKSNFLRIQKDKSKFGFANLSNRFWNGFGITGHATKFIAFKISKRFGKKWHKQRWSSQISHGMGHRIERVVCDHEAHYPRNSSGKSQTNIRFDRKFPDSKNDFSPPKFIDGSAECFVVFGNCLFDF